MFRAFVVWSAFRTDDAEDLTSMKKTMRLIETITFAGEASLSS